MTTKTGHAQLDGPPPAEYKRPAFTYGDNVQESHELALAALLDAVIYASDKVVRPTPRMDQACWDAAQALVPGEVRSGPDALKRTLDQWVRSRE